MSVTLNAGTYCRRLLLLVALAAHMASLDVVYCLFAGGRHGSFPARDSDDPHPCSSPD
jgi:hypothetical protein